jgi:two-component system NtrC family response regulator
MILIVDDDASVHASLGLLLKQAGHPWSAVSSRTEAMAWLAANSCELVLQDMNFSRETSGAEGLALLREIRAAHPELPVILMTAWGSIPLAVEGMRLGAGDFITKPWTNTQVVQSVETALGLARAPEKDVASASREQLDNDFDFAGLVGEDPGLLRVLQIIGRVAATDASVLITGESGTGKELVAEAIHRNSKRRSGPFVKVNLGGIPTGLFESEMFGHVKGAFTDARSDRVGRFSLANGGTIFLDEVGELDPASQVKMLRVLQDRTFEVLGSSQTRSVDVRVVAATNRNLRAAVETGAFREDLFYRLNLIAIHLPPLRDRRGDIPLLARQFLHAVMAAHGREGLELSASAIDHLKAQDWPGNIRELRHTIERAVLVAPRPLLGAADFRDVASMEAPGTARDPLPPVGSMTLDQIERAMIVKSLRHHAGNLTRVAESLGMSRPALYRRIEKHAITV